MAKRSWLSVICLLFLAQMVDFSTAYLNYLTHPAFFFQYETNIWTKHAFYYGEWWMVLIPLAIYEIAILVLVGILKYLKKEIILNFCLLIFVSISITAALTNVHGIYNNTALDARLIIPLYILPTLITLPMGFYTQFIVDKERENQKLSTQGA